MSISFDNIKIGSTYSRIDLAKEWDYESFHALARGVVTPKNQNKIILFVTSDKQTSAEQYEDNLIGNILDWDGPNDHFAEERMLSAKQNGDEIHLFYRERHHSSFTYFGQLEVVNFEPRVHQPSHFRFQLLNFVS